MSRVAMCRYPLPRRAGDIVCTVIAQWWNWQPSSYRSLAVSALAGFALVLFGLRLIGADWASALGSATGTVAAVFLFGRRRIARSEP